ncbi:hypothetical protein BAAA27672_05910 [Bifidobacterium animalis subsp. animalis ATCC 27672]|nr:hypothetical protein BAAA27672_05910 [Bifidobacterium animalis subsp. animalis ATCC 27672]
MNNESTGLGKNNTRQFTRYLTDNRETNSKLSALTRDPVKDRIIRKIGFFDVSMCFIKEKSNWPILKLVLSVANISV